MKPQEFARFVEEQDLRFTFGELPELGTEAEAILCEDGQMKRGLMVLHCYEGGNSVGKSEIEFSPDWSMRLPTFLRILNRLLKMNGLTERELENMDDELDVLKETVAMNIAHLRNKESVDLVEKSGEVS